MKRIVTSGRIPRSYMKEFLCDQKNPFHGFWGKGPVLEIAFDRTPLRPVRRVFGHIVCEGRSKSEPPASPSVR